MKGLATRGSAISFGEYGLKTLEAAWITDRQIEAARIAMTRHIKRGGKIWIRMFPDKPVTKKPAETRMGKGKGAPEYWVAVVKPGRILYEIEGVDEKTARAERELENNRVQTERSICVKILVPYFPRWTPAARCPNSRVRKHATRRPRPRPGSAVLPGVAISSSDRRRRSWTMFSP